MAQTKAWLVCVILAITLTGGWGALTWLRTRPLIPASGGCGPKSLLAVSRRLGVHTDAHQVFALFGGEVTMSNFSEMQRPAQQLGLNTQGFWMNVDELHRRHPLGILHIGPTHFVGLTGYAPNGVEVVDPEVQNWAKETTQFWSDEDLASRWDGRILVVSRKGTP